MEREREREREIQTERERYRRREKVKESGREGGEGETVAPTLLRDRGTNTTRRERQNLHVDF